MIISRTPFRISFFGGGTDYPAWYREDGGAVISTTIDKYCYISCRFLPPFFDHRYLIRYRIIETVNKLSDIQHPSVRECLRFMGIEDGIEMVHNSDLPARSGIGSSSAFTVGFLNSLYALTGRMIGKRKLASDAMLVEQQMIRENVGSQDQVAAAFGGLNRIEFNGCENFIVSPVTIDRRKIKTLQNNLMFFFSGLSRTASEIAEDQINNVHSNASELRTMRNMVDEAVEILNGPIDDLENFGRLMNESWKLKRTLSSRVSNTAIDDMYQTALDAGAVGGKLCGAGGGGFILFFVPPRKQRSVRRALKDLLYVPFQFDTLGSHIILYANKEYESKIPSLVCA